MIKFFVIPFVPFALFHLFAKREKPLQLFVRYCFAVVFSFCTALLVYLAVSFFHETGKDLIFKDMRVIAADFVLATGFCFLSRYFAGYSKGGVQKHPTVLPVLLVLVNFVSFFLVASVLWYKVRYGVTIRELLNIALMPLKGTAQDVTSLLTKAVALSSVLALTASSLVYAVVWRAKTSPVVEFDFPRKRIAFSAIPCARKAHVVLTIVLFAYSLFLLNSTLDIFGYVRSQSEETQIYEEYYSDPRTVKITPPEKLRNLIYIYLESMETTYASADAGGTQQVNYIPHLTELARQNVNFSAGDSLGGAYALNGSTWTMGALFSTQAGIPFSFPVNGNSMNNFEYFAKGAVALGDILEGFGYNQEFLCGSDGDFAGRKQFFEQHGGFKVFDLFEARRQGYISALYKVWWGFEDAILFKIAKDEVLRLAGEGKPFNLTLLTVDTHHVGGYKCSLCGDEYSENLANVLVCQDKQVAEFVGWLKAQEFWDDTLVVITGDHPRADKILVGDAGLLERPVYDCFLNAKKQARQKGRRFALIDYFPTVLSALGFEIEGDRLGLGTDLFSDRQTLSEELGLEYLNGELAKRSAFYMATFP